MLNRFPRWGGKREIKSGRFARAMRISNDSIILAANGECSFMKSAKRPACGQFHARDNIHTRTRCVELNGPKNEQIDIMKGSSRVGGGGSDRPIVCAGRPDQSRR